MLTNERIVPNTPLAKEPKSLAFSATRYSPRKAPVFNVTIKKTMIITCELKVHR
jgi:hypothetical protein